MIKVIKNFIIEMEVCVLEISYIYLKQDNANNDKISVRYYLIIKITRITLNN